jgi:uncharacterized OB-fold protein
MKKVQINSEMYEKISQVFHGEIFRRKDKDGNCFMNVSKKQEKVLRENNLIIDKCNNCDDIDLHLDEECPDCGRKA